MLVVLQEVIERSRLATARHGQSQTTGSVQSIPTQSRERQARSTAGKMDLKLRPPLNSRKDQGRVIVLCADLKAHETLNRIDQLCQNANKTM